MHWIKRILGAAVLAAPPAQAGEAYAALYRLYDYPEQLRLEAVPVCFHHGCASVKRVRLGDAQWQKLAGHFDPPAADPAGERAQIRRAIAEMEQLVGELAGTSGDRAGDLAGFGTLEPQMDCVDESANTTTYLTLFEEHGLLRWHRVEPLAHRGYLLFGGWPHFTAVIRDRQTDRRWVVDSWFHDNGLPPEILDLETWKAGWKPQEPADPEHGS